MVPLCGFQMACVSLKSSMFSVVYYAPQKILTFDKIALAHDIHNLPKALKGDQGDAIDIR